VLGLDPSEAPYQDCIASLERNSPPADPPQSVGALRSADDQKTNAACADIGLDSRSAAFSECVADLNETLSDQGQIFR